MPQTAEGEGEQHKQALPGRSPPVAPQRDVYILPKPAGQGDVPPLPKLGDRAGKIGPLEVGHQLYAHHSSTAPGNVGVTAEIAVNLNGKGTSSQHQRTALVAARIFVHRVYNQQSQLIRNHHFLEETPGHPFGPERGVLICEPVFLLQLGQKAGGFFNGTGHQLGKEGDKQGKGDKIPLRLQPAFVDVQGVAESLEGIKGDAHRQDDVQRRGREGDGERTAQGGKTFAEKIQVFEEKQQP